MFAPLLTVPAKAAGWFRWLNPELKHLEDEQARAAAELEALGTPYVGNTVPEYGYQHAERAPAEDEPAWVQIDLREKAWIDCVALVPALSNWQTYNRTAYRFPLRFRVDVSDDSTFGQFVTLGNFTDADFPDPGVVPVVIRGQRQRARYVRVTVTKMLRENGNRFFALSEVMVLSGNLNIAIGRPVYTSGAAPSLAWKSANLVDGRTPLGPPIEPLFVRRSGFYVVPEKDVTPVIDVDLGRERVLQQLRIHPVHARDRVDTAGASFPGALRVVAARTEDFLPAVTLYDSDRFANPGNNPLTINGRDVPARYLRIVAEVEVPDDRIGLSELEIFSDGQNIAQEATIVATPDRAGMPQRWPETLLQDGLVSFGRLLDLPEWLRGWERRRELVAEIARIEQRKVTATALARQRVLWLGAFGAALALVAIVALWIVSRCSRARELRELRARLARDLHDEIGSNLAGLAVLTEYSGRQELTLEQHRENWNEAQRTAEDTIAAMREVLWLTDPREVSEGDFVTHLRSIAARMLTGKEVHWIGADEPLPADLSPEARRNISLFFKEALANVIRHSRATRVQLALRVAADELELVVADNGSGFDPSHTRQGIGLRSLQKRSEALRGVTTIESCPGGGAKISLRAPINVRPAWPRKTELA